MVDYPKDWEKTQLINILSIKKGKQKNSNEISSWAKYPHINGGIEESGYTFEWNTHPDTITISEGGNSCGFVNFQKRKFWAGGHCYVVLPDNRFVDTEFLYYLLKSHQNNLMSLRVGSGLPNIQSKSLLEYEVNLTHNKMEQKAIAETLMTFDRHIENMERLIHKKKMIRDGAVEDLMTGKTRLDGFNGEWEEKCLAKICNIYDGTHQTPKYTNNGIRFVSVEDISNLKDSRKFISINDFRKDFKIYPENKDILMTRIGDIGTPCLLKDDEKIAYYVSLALLKNIKINSKYLYQYIRSSNFKNELDKRILHHATPIKINKNDIGKCQVNYPTDIKEQEAIASILTSMDKEIENLEKEKAKIEKIKAGAMDDLLTGKVRLI